jgi:glycosyltransferase involved in cell wall biosynthesis
MTSLQRPPLSVEHFAEDGDTSGYFPALAKYHDRARYAMSFATLRAMTPALRDFMREQGVNSFSCGATGRLTHVAAAIRLLRHLRSRPTTILHTHLFGPSVVGLAAARIAGVPARILTRHYSNYHTRINRPLHVQLDKFCTSAAHHVIAVSNETAEHLVRVEGAPPQKVTAIHNGIDFDRVKVSGPDARQRLRIELKLGDDFTFLIAGRLHPEKGYEHLFEAIRLLKDRADRPFVLLVAGRGPLLEHYERLVAGLGIGDHVRFLGFRNDLPDLMVAGDLFVLPSVAESFGLVLAEALYLGTPVVASRVGGIPEIVDDGIDGCLVPPGDARALSEIMEKFLRGSVRLPGMGQTAVAKVRARFDFQQMLRKYEAVYERVLDAPR